MRFETGSRLGLGVLVLVSENARIFGFPISAAYKPDPVNTRRRGAYAAELELPLLTGSPRQIVLPRWILRDSCAESSYPSCA